MSGETPAERIAFWRDVKRRLTQQHVDIDRLWKNAGAFLSAGVPLQGNGTITWSPVPCGGCESVESYEIDVPSGLCLIMDAQVFTVAAGDDCTWSGDNGSGTFRAKLLLTGGSGDKVELYEITGPTTESLIAVYEYGDGESDQMPCEGGELNFADAFCSFPGVHPATITVTAV